MENAKDFLTEEELERISRALGEAESRTSGEIVPVVATESGRYDRAEDVVGLLTALVTLGVFWFFFQGAVESRDGWSSGAESVRLGFWWTVLIVVTGFALGAVLATCFPALRLPFITKREMVEEVERRAEEAFTRFRVGKTAGATGILVFVSLYEHMVVVRGDYAIAEKLASEDWKHVRDAILDGIKRNEPGEGLRAGIRECGELLAKHFPIAEGDVNELGNELHLLD